jgi:arylsulfatase A-like enzyme
VKRFSKPRFVALAVAVLGSAVAAIGAPVDPAWGATVPNTFITSGPTQPVSTSSSATFTFTSTDPAATFECRRDGLSWFACTSPRTETNFGNNVHNYDVRAKNSAGTDATPARWTWTVNTTGGSTTVPDTTITSGPDRPVSTSSTATFTFTATDPAATFECRRDGLTWFPCTSPRVETGFSENFHNYDVRARNSRGTDLTPARWSWTVDVDAAPPPSPPGGPNVIVINADDLRADNTAHVMTKIRNWFAAGGTEFPNGYASTPVCCPSRSNLFSGRYTHNHGNLNNQTTKNLDMDATIQSYLKKAGYQTGMAGKFLLDWSNSVRPPFFDMWALTKGNYVNVPFGTDQGSLTAAYSTTEIRRQALRMLDRFEQNDSRPFYLYLAPQAPHAPFTPEPKYAGANVGPCNPSPGVLETDKSDKPSWVRQYNTSQATGCADRQGQLRTMLSVDDMVDAVMNRLLQQGELDNTLVVFTSDNGYLWAEHGVREKFIAYTESIRVPFLVRWPGHVPAGFVDTRPVANVDIAPAILAAAGISPTLKYPFDGRPFLSATGLSTETRPEAYFEYNKDANRPTFPSWRSIRTATVQYIEWYDTAGAIVFREYYNVVSDPYQLTNLLSDGNPANNPDVSGFSARLAAYRTCKGTSGANPCP